MSLELLDGRLALKLDFGNGLHSIGTNKQFNDGKWTHVVVYRNFNTGKCCLLRLWIMETVSD